MNKLTLLGAGIAAACCVLMSNAGSRVNDNILENTVWINNLSKLRYYKPVNNVLEREIVGNDNLRYHFNKDSVLMMNFSHTESDEIMSEGKWYLTGDTLVMIITKDIGVRSNKLETLKSPRIEKRILEFLTKDNYIMMYAHYFDDKNIIFQESYERFVKLDKNGDRMRADTTAHKSNK